MLRMIAGVDEPTSGKVFIEGRMVAGNGVHVPPEKRSVGLMFQDFALFPHLTVVGNIGFGLVGPRQDGSARIDELVEKFGLSAMRDRYPHQISGGEQQRVALARAVAPRPRVMLLDEPFSSFDDRLRDGIREETIAVLRSEGAAVLLVTHEPAEAMRVADRILLMRGGRIVQSGPPIELYREPVDREAAEFFSDLNMVHGVVRDSEVETVFGKFCAKGLVDGADVEIVIRPQYVRMSLDRAGRGPEPSAAEGVAARAKVVRSVFLGNSSLVEFRLDDDNSLVRAQIPSVFLPRPGEVLWLSFARNRCHLFPCAVQSRVNSPYAAAGAGETVRPGISPAAAV